MTDFPEGVQEVRTSLTAYVNDLDAKHTEASDRLMELMQLTDPSAHDLGEMHVMSARMTAFTEALTMFTKRMRETLQ